ncbi:pentatricopeptide repeat-containing protein At5g15280, mitochondrial isoform X2 [Triticum urartu]|uniref:pentatricopeptide repeat-containing protein At5g15280, mitochondrial isoform X2 n=1 Tax=Triticum urartu TaxID=4572 RepID=UPI0020433535|nr:pentatricopeptide repeat-containing protein At5g15280, mitochondrial isoform X2 [Triticum urartu]
MWKAWQLRRAIHLRRRRPSSNLRREPKIGHRGYANNAPELNSNKGSLFDGERCYTLGKKEGTSLCNSAVAGSSEEAGFSAEHETGEKCEADVHLVAKLGPGIGKLIVSKCSFIFDTGRDTFEGNCSLRDVLKLGLWLSPETLRRFWRASRLRPEDFLDILIGFGPGAAEVRNARFLWNMYRWASWQSKDFRHLPRSNDIMVSILADAHMLNQAESLLLLLDDNRALTDASRLFSQITQMYSEAGHLDKSVALFDRARSKCLVPSASCYQVLLNRLVGKRKEALVLRVYVDMLEVGLGSCTEGDVLDFVVNDLVKGDKFLQAIRIIRQLKSLNIEISKGSLSTVAKEFCKKKDIGDMMNFLEEWRILLAGYCKYRQFDDIEHILRTMETNGVNDLPSGNCVLSKALSFLGLDHLGVKVKRDNATGFPKAEFFDSVGNGLYLDTDSKRLEISLVQILDNALYLDINSKIVSACQQGNVASALLLKNEAFQWGHYISPASSSELIKSLCASPAHVMDVIDLMKEMPYTFDKLDAQTLNLVVQTLSKNEMSACARLVLDRLFRRGLPVNQDTYTYLLLGFCTERNIAGFWECWNVATKFSWSPDKKDVIPLISHLCKWGVMEEALQLISALLDCYPYLFFSAYCALLKELCRTGYTNVGCAMLEALLEKGVDVSRSLILNVAEGFLKEQRTVESIGLYDICLNKIKVSDVFTHQFAFSSLAWFDAERCKDLVQSMMKTECSDVPACSCIVNELLQTGKVSQAISVVQASTLGKKLSDKLLNSILQSYCCLNNWRKVDAVLCIMLKIHASISISSYRLLVRRMCEQSQFSSALCLKELMQDSEKSTDLILYNILLFCLFKRRNILQVHELLKDMKGNGISPDKTTYDFLVYGFHKSGDTDRSVTMLDACIAQGLTPTNRSLRIVLSHHCMLGNLEKALELFHLIEGSGWKHGLVIELTLISALLSFGRNSEAKSCLNNLSRSALTTSYISFDVLIKEFCRQGDVEMSVNLINTMLKHGRLPSEASYSSVIHRLCILKEFDRALDFLAEMQLENLKPSERSCDVLMRGLCSMGRTSDAKKILDLLRTFGSAASFGMYRTVFDNYRRCNNTPEAAGLLHDMQQAGHVPNFEMQWSVISNLSSTDRKTEGYEQPILSKIISSSQFPMKDNRRK